MPEKRRVVITGIGIVSPVGNSRESTWNAVLKGESGVREISIFDAHNFPCRIAGEVKNFDLDSIIPKVKKKLKKYIARGAGFGIAASYEAMEDAGLLESNNDRLGVCIGNSGQRAFLKDWGEIHKAYLEKFKTMPFINITDFLKNKYHTCAELISIFHNAQAFNYSISTACASGTQALGLAYRMIQGNQADVVISGGCDSMINEIDLMSFCLLGAVTTEYNDNPQRGSCPFSKQRSGFVLGEGGAMLILEELEHAIKRNAKIYGEVAGYGTTMSAYSLTDPPPNGEAAYSSMMRLKDWDWTLNVNGRGAFLCTKEAAKLMDKDKPTYIINITSMGSRRVLPEYGAVGCSKAVLESLGRYAAVEYAGDNIIVNTIAGGVVETEALDAFPHGKDIVSIGKEKTPAGKLIVPEDIANLAVLLTSGKADMVRGQTIVVDGGFSLF